MYSPTSRMTPTNSRAWTAMACRSDSSGRSNSRVAFMSHLLLGEGVVLCESPPGHPSRQEISDAAPLSTLYSQTCLEIPRRRMSSPASALKSSTESIVAHSFVTASDTPSSDSKLMVIVPLAMLPLPHRRDGHHEVPGLSGGPFLGTHLDHPDAGGVVAHEVHHLAVGGGLALGSHLEGTHRLGPELGAEIGLPAVVVVPLRGQVEPEGPLDLGAHGHGEALGGGIVYHQDAEPEEAEVETPRVLGVLPGTPRRQGQLGNREVRTHRT